MERDAATGWPSDLQSRSRGFNSRLRWFDYTSA